MLSSYDDLFCIICTVLRSRYCAIQHSCCNTNKTIIKAIIKKPPVMPCKQPAGACYRRKMLNSSLALLLNAARCKWTINCLAEQQVSRGVARQCRYNHRPRRPHSDNCSRRGVVVSDVVSIIEWSTSGAVSTQPPIHPGSVKWGPASAGKAWLITFADEFMGVHVKLVDPPTTRAIPQRFWV